MTSSDNMISRRQIIRGQQQQQQEAAGGAPGQQSAGNNSSSTGGAGQANSRLLRSQQHQLNQQQQQQQLAPKSKPTSRKIMAPSSRQLKDELQQQQQQQQQDSSDGYIAASSHQYQDYMVDGHHSSKDGYASWRPPTMLSADERAGPELGAGASGSGGSGSQSQAGYHPFDPYYVDTVEEDVWYSEERLFEDHLEEIFNKWRLLDDDIWCKLIIMERNRRIGKAYARVPIVTIDGSHEQSYDGYKLALNGFDNPDRDPKTEECRKRIGKGIRIKMDNFGNILIKRLSKYNVYIKDWISTTSQSSSGGGGSNSTSGRLMPSRQQLIKNQNNMMAAMVNNGRMGGPGSQMSSSIATSVTPSSGSSGGGSSMDPPNDSAICDEVISAGGQLDQDKIYVMFDMKKFQANVTQELCRPYPDKRKLEQQCFSIISLTRDADEILNLPCWVMVINIVAIEMLNERFPLMNNHHTSFPDTMLLDSSSSSGPNHRGRANPMQAPNFVSIFERNGHERGLPKDDQNNKEEDPYSLPANASSSDVKSSINDYGTASTKNISSFMADSNGAHQHHQNHMSPSARYYGGSKRAEMYAHKRELPSGRGNSMMDNIKHRSRSNGNIFGPSSSKPINPSSRYNNGQSIYSPGHMLVPPTGDSAVPPKLPPRDFVKKGKSKSSTNVNNEDKLFKMEQPDESIYSTGLQQPQLHPSAMNDTDGAKVRKTKKNRFLESLKAPLELAKSSRSASVLGTPVQSVASESVLADNNSKKLNQSKSKGFSKSSAKNLKSFLGVKGAKSKDTISDDSNYVHVDGVDKIKGSTRLLSQDSAEVDSVVDSTEDVDDGQQVALQSSSSASYNDLDIPTPDYETDENIYALDDGNGGYRGYTTSVKSPHDNQRRSAGSNNKSGSKNSKNSKHNKDDLYYSGFLAHVPNGIGPANEKISCISNARENSRFMLHNKMDGMPRMSGRDMIYGSTTGLPPMQANGQRYRSASMQRYYSRSQVTARSQSEMYDLETEVPYAMSGGIDPQGHYGVTGIAGAGGHRRRSGSKTGNSFVHSVGGAPLHRVGSSMANSNYDIGRSSSGIYGNNSSSSSSDYADWHPQMRKVNSSGYLNSIFKNHLASPVESFNNTNPLNINNNNSSNNNNNNNNNINSNPMAAHSYKNNNVKQQRSYASRTLKTGRPAPTLSKQQQQQQTQQQQQQQQHQQRSKIHQVPSSIVNGPAYRSYDSSNDSEPSYTNSSDGLDIYDHIGAHGRLNHHHHHQFLDLPDQVNITPEIHVGEWENMYDR